MALLDAFGTVDDSTADPQDVLNKLTEQQTGGTLQPNENVDPQSIVNRLIRRGMAAPQQRSAASQQGPDFSSFGKTSQELGPNAAPNGETPDFASFGEPTGTPVPGGVGETPVVGSQLGVAGRALLQGVPEGVGGLLEGAATMSAPPPTVQEAAAGEAAPTGYGGESPIGPEADVAAAKAQAPVTASPLYKAGQAVEDWTKNNLPTVTPAERAAYPITTALAGGVGGTLPYVAAGMVNPALGIVGGAVMMGLQGAGDTYDAAIKNGADDATARNAAQLAGAADTALGALPIAAVLAPIKTAIPAALQGAFSGYATQILARAAENGVVFTSVGEAQQYIGAQIAKEYDPNAHYSFDVERVIGEFGAGAILSGFHDLWQGKPAEQPAVNINTTGDTTQTAGGLPPPGQAGTTAGTAQPGPQPQPGAGGAGEQAPGNEPHPQPPPPEGNFANASFSPTRRRTMAATAAYYGEYTPDEISKWSDGQLAAYLNLKDKPQQSARNPEDVSNMDAAQKAQAAQEEAAQGYPSQAAGTEKEPIDLRTTQDVRNASANATEDNPRYATWNGLGLKIEVPPGGVREGVVKGTGERWESTHPDAYGEFTGLPNAGDNMALDVIVGPHPNAPSVYVLDEFDRYNNQYKQAKAFVGFQTPAQAYQSYVGISSKHPDQVGGMRAYGRDEFVQAAQAGEFTGPVSDAGIARANNNVAQKQEPSPTNAVGPEVQKPEQFAGPEPTAQDRQAIVDALQRVGTAPKDVRPVIIEQAAEIHQNEGLSPEDAYQLAVARSLVADKVLTPEQVREQYGEQIASLLEPKWASQQRLRAAPRSPGAGGEAAAPANERNQGGAQNGVQGAENAEAVAEPAGQYGRGQTGGAKPNAAQVAEHGAAEPVGRAGGEPAETVEHEPAKDAASAALIGKPVTLMGEHNVTAADGTRVKVAPVVVEADDLVASNDQGYDKRLQPRDRERAASQTQVRNIATNLAPERLGYSAEADRGAPIVLPNGQVLSGNGRVNALRQVYSSNPEKAKAYKFWLGDQGVDVKQYKKPILVRQLRTNMSHDELQHFAVAANVADTLSMSAPERAMADAKRIDYPMLTLLKDGDLNSLENHRFVRTFANELPTSERGSIASKDGKLSAEGLTRIRNAVLAKAYGDPDVLSRITESTDDDVKSISNALVAASPQWAKLKGDIEDGRVPQEFDLTPELVEAVKRTADMRGKGMKLEEYLAQQDAFDQIPEDVDLFIRSFYDPNTKRAKASARIGDFLRFYATEAAKQSTEAGLGLGMPEVTPHEIQSAALEKTELRQAPTQSGKAAGARGQAAGNAKQRPATGANRGRPNAAGGKPSARFGEPEQRFATEPGADNKPQYVIPGTERRSSAELAQRIANQPLRPRVAQKPANEGLFGETAKQEELLAAQQGRQPLSYEERQQRDQTEGGPTERTQRWRVAARGRERFYHEADQVGRKVYRGEGLTPAEERIANTVLAKWVARSTAEYNTPEAWERRIMAGLPGAKFDGGRLSNVDEMRPVYAELLRRRLAMPDLSDQMRREAEASLKQVESLINRRVHYEAVGVPGFGDLEEHFADLFGGEGSHDLFGNPISEGTHGTPSRASAQAPRTAQPAVVRGGAAPLFEGAVSGQVRGAGAKRGAKGPSLFDWTGSERPLPLDAQSNVDHPANDEAPVRPEAPAVTKPPRDSAPAGNADRPARAPKRGLSEAQEKIAERSRLNYRITPDDHIGEGGPKGKVRGNIEAIKILKAVEDEKRFPTPEEKAKLVKYVGWGQFAQDMFAEHKPEWTSERAELKNLLTPEEYEAARASTLNAHFTSPEVIEGIWRTLDHLGFDGGSALEPAAGVGHFIGSIPDRVAPKTDWTAVELDPITGRIAKSLYGGADVNIGGYEDLQRPSNYYDLAVSNVPFGDYSITKKPYGSFPIHNFFFVKALDQVRPGGVVAFVTSRYTMDAKDPAFRKLLAQKADLVGAFRLPGGKKGAFAKNAGTEVTTDVIFLRKKVPGEPPLKDAPKWTEVKDFASEDGPIPINEYFRHMPEMMLGEMRLQGTMYGKNEPVLVPREGLDLANDMEARAVNWLPRGVFLPRQTPPPETIHANDIEGPVKDGAFFVKGGKVFQRKAGQGHEQQLGPTDQDRMARLVTMRDHVNDLLGAQLANQPTEAASLRNKLSNAYRAFVRKYGPINHIETTVTKRLNKAGEPVVIERMPNFDKFRSDPDAYKVSAIEDYDRQTDKGKPAAIQERDVIAPPEGRDIKSPADALAASLDAKGEVDLDHIANSLGLPNGEAAAHMLGDLIYQDPDGRQWKTVDEYLSGEVVKKLEDARAIAEHDPAFKRNVEALEKAQPKPLTRMDITAQMGAPWIPEDVYEQFAKEELGANSAKVKLVPVTNAWRATTSGVSRDAASKYATHDFSPEQIFRAAINNKQLTAYDRLDDGSSVVNAIRTEEARVKTRLMREAFSGDIDKGMTGWVFGDNDRAQRLEAIYNRTNNDLAPRKFDGSHLTLPGLDPMFKGYRHRKDAIWRIVQKGNTLLAHEVGLGKTVTMIGAGQEMKRLGLIRKPAYVVPNHMLEQFSREFIQAYPNAKILVASKEETSRDARKAFVAKVAANDWDGVVITHDAFGRINMGLDWRKDFVKQQIDELDRIMAAEQGERGSNDTVKQLEKAKKRLQDRLLKLMNQERKDEGVNFEESGIDHLFVDEAHKFKNLSFITRMSNIKGLSASASQRAEDLFLKIRYLEAKRPGRSAVFATGTPVSNTMAELWTMQRYLQLDALRQRGMDSFDGWAGTFGDTVTRPELAADGRSLKDVTSFSKFVNIPELMNLYSSIADYKTAEMVGNVVRPQIVKPDGSPGITVVPSQPSPQEDAYIQGLVKRAEEGFGRAKKGEPNYLSAVLTPGRKVALDGRLVGLDYNPSGKIANLVENVHREWQNGQAPALAQMVFLDMGTPVAERTAPTPEEIEEGAFDDQDPAKEGTPKVNLYEDIKRRLIERGIPAKQIAFIHDANTDLKKGRLFEKVRSGEVRVILGSSEKMGVGTNVQKQLIAGHQVDPPYKPAEVNQRSGRWLRQGNLNPQIREYHYVTQRSFDGFMWQTLERKAKFLTQIMSGAAGKRVAEDVDSPLPSAAELKAAASGDQRIFQFAELQRDLNQLLAQKRFFEQSRAEAFHQAKSAQSNIAMYQRELPAAKATAGKLQDLRGDKFKMQIGFKDFTDRVDAGKQVLNQILAMPVENFYTPKTIRVGTLSGLDANVRVSTHFTFDPKTGKRSYELFVQPNISGQPTDAGLPRVYTSQSGVYLNPALPPGDNAFGVIRRFENILGQIAEEPARLERNIADETKNVERLKSVQSGAWPKEGELAAVSAQYKALETELKAPKGQPKSEAGIPSEAANAGETGGEVANSSKSALPATQAPPLHSSTFQAPSGSSTSRYAPPSIFPVERTLRFSGRLGDIDQASSKHILQGSNDINALLGAATENKPALESRLAEIAHNIPGIVFSKARVKDAMDLIDKVQAKGRAPNTISDYLGARVVAHSPEALHQFVDALHQTGGVIEAEDFVGRGKDGYRAYHLQVGLGDGTSAEIQVVPKPIADKMDEAHAVRQPFKRILDNPHPTATEFANARAAMTKAAAIQDDNWAKHPEWTQAFSDLGNRMLPPGTDLGPFQLIRGMPLGEQAQNHVVNRGWMTGDEHLVAFHDNGTVVANTRGNQRGVSIPDEANRKIWDKNYSIVVHHNHPSNNTLSDQDIAMLAAPGVHSIWAHGHGGTVSRAALTPYSRSHAKDPNGDHTALRRLYNNLRETFERPLVEPHKAGLISGKRADALTGYLANEALRRAGIIDYQTNDRFEKEIEQFGLQPHIDFAVASMIRRLQNAYGKPIPGDDRLTGRFQHVGDVGAVFERPPSNAPKPARPAGVNRPSAAQNRREAPRQLDLLAGLADLPDLFRKPDAMQKKAVYGLPLTPRHLIEQLKGASFNVSYGTRKDLGKQLDDAIRLVGKDGLLLVDNGAFTLHQQDKTTPYPVQDFEKWAADILSRSPQAVAVIPDVIGGSEEQNAKLVNDWVSSGAVPMDRSMPIWHMGESLDYLRHLLESGFNHLGIGSSGQFFKVGTPDWHRRIDQAFATIKDLEDQGLIVRPRIHMMRAQAQHPLYPFDTSDSTNLAQNQYRTKDQPQHVAAIAKRIDAKIAASSTGEQAPHQVARPHPPEDLGPSDADLIALHDWFQRNYEIQKANPEQGYFSDTTGRFSQAKAAAGGAGGKQPPPGGTKTAAPPPPNKAGRFGQAVADFLGSDNMLTAKEYAQDYNARLEKLQRDVDSLAHDWIAPNGDLPDEYQAYQLKRLVPGKRKNVMSEYTKQQVEPMDKLLRDNGISGREASDYLYALHAPERNRIIGGSLYGQSPLSGQGEHPFSKARRDPNIVGASGMSKAQADKIVNGARKGPKAAAYRQIEKQFGEWRKYYQGQLLRGGLESQDTISEWNRTYDHYAPLRGWEDPTEALDEAPQGKGRGGGDIRGPESKQALGRGTKADNVITNMADMTYRAIDRAERNLALQGLARLLNAAGPEVRKELGVTLNKGRMKRVVDKNTGMLKNVQDSFDPQRENAVHMKVRGEGQYMVFDDVRLARAVKRWSPYSNTFLGFFNRLVSRWKSMLTHYNPLFMPRHMARYYVEGMANSMELKEHGNFSVLKFAGDAFPLLGETTRAIFNVEHGRPGGKMGEYWKEMKAGGGATSLFAMRDFDDLLTRLKSEAATIGTSAYNPKRVMRTIAEAVDQFTGIIDNSTRLAAYAQAREQGMSIQKASMVAREATVDYDLRGIASNMAAMWAPFQNVATQTGYRMGSAVAGGHMERATGHTPARRMNIMRKVFLGTFALGFLAGTWNYFFGGQDKDKMAFFDKMPPWTRSKALALYLGLSDAQGRPQPIIWPFPFNYAFPLTMGQTVAGLLFGTAPKAKYLAEAIGSMVSSFSELGEQGLAWRDIAPEILRPWMDVALNKSWTGAHVHADTDYQKGPNAESGFKPKGTYEGTPSWWTDIAKFLNNYTGGDARHSGWLDFYPEDIEYIMNSYFGGQVRPAEEIAKAGQAVTQGKWPDPTQIPIGSVFYGTNYDKATAAEQRERRYEQKHSWLGQDSTPRKPLIDLSR